MKATVSFDEFLPFFKQKLKSSRAQLEKRIDIGSCYHYLRAADWGDEIPWP
jgi:hypothetical protein